MEEKDLSWRMEKALLLCTIAEVGMAIIITGSLAYDNILKFPGFFKEHILPDKIEKLNVSFLVDSMKKLRGGCAANIAYSLALLGKRPHVMGTVGEDFGEFRTWMEAQGIETSLIKVIPGEYTASCFITTDRSSNQITGFYAGAMASAHTLSFHELKNEKVEIAIISPNDPGAMVKYCRECREASIPFIFDPGHQIPRLEPEQILENIRGSRFTIQNDYELDMILHKTGKSEQELLEITGGLIVTKGSQGSFIKTKEQTYSIPPVTPRIVADPTGAGDAYRSAIIMGILCGLDFMAMGKLASLVATYVVEVCGTTEHHFTFQELKARYEQVFGEALPMPVPGEG
ncbi:MAG: carbohydrate kinase family protein [Candidatus Eremiobacteraeota bacterium]|nr:carbohydrate kinase family protein [Candidatus Eremiobacteraeota bacterium]